MQVGDKVQVIVDMGESSDSEVKMEWAIITTVCDEYWECKSCRNGYVMRYPIC